MRRCTDTHHITQNGRRMVVPRIAWTVSFESDHAGISFATRSKVTVDSVLDAIDLERVVDTQELNLVLIRYWIHFAHCELERHVAFKRSFSKTYSLIVIERIILVLCSRNPAPKKILV